MKLTQKLLWSMMLLLVLNVFGGCKKQIEQAKTDAIVDVMVANKWIVLQYMEGANNVSDEFAGYDFQFNRDNSVIGANGTVSKTGTWSGNIANQSISTNFPNTTAKPLARLNGIWTVYYYDSEGPKFNQIINGVEMKLVLRKK